MAGREKASHRSLLTILQARLKQYPGLYYRLVDILAPVLPTGDRSRWLVAQLPPDALILNLGSGPLCVSPRVVNVDLFPFKTVDVIADLNNLPFADETVSGVICKAALEHVRNPKQVIAEIRRILRPDGLIFIVVPFIVGFHAAPSDYHRWTLRGVEDCLMKDFREVKSGLRGGPTSALSWVLQEWLSMVCSLGWDPLYQVLRLVFMVALFPLKYLDLLVARHPRAAHVSSGFSIVARK
jgi:SAM-dependent methyltransferase